MTFPTPSIRTRILLWHGLLLACILTAFGVTAHRLYWENELARLDRELDEPVSLLHRSMHAQNMRTHPTETLRLRDMPPPEDFTLSAEAAPQFASHHWLFAVWTRHGKLLAKSDALAQTLGMPPVSGLVPFVTQRRSAGVMREAFIATPSGECLLAAVAMESELRAASRLGWWLLALGAGVLGAGLLVDAWILRRAIQPVEDIISAAERISRGNLGTRIESNATSAELDRLTNVLNTTFASLDRAFTQQARFSADVAHELRTPVSVLITEAQTALERERSGEEYRDTISTTLRSARRMGGLIESLLALAQIQSGADAQRGACDLAALTADVIGSLRTTADAHGIELRSSLAAAACQGNADHISQIITNLTINAIQHNQRGGHVFIETLSDGGRAVFRVENSGPGIPPDDLPHVFERFYRADASRSRKTGGVGLGLAICKAIADAHGATLEVASSPGIGCTFTLRMPPGN